MHCNINIMSLQHRIFDISVSC